MIGPLHVAVPPQRHRHPKPGHSVAEPHSKRSLYTQHRPSIIVPAPVSYCSPLLPVSSLTRQTCSTRDSPSLGAARPTPVQSDTSETPARASLSTNPSPSMRSLRFPVAIATDVGPRHAVHRAPVCQASRTHMQSTEVDRHRVVRLRSAGRLPSLDLGGHAGFEAQAGLRVLLVES